MQKHLALLAATLLAPASLLHAEPPKDATRVPVTITGGHDTEAVDRGRPVTLIAAALGVKPEVFRKAFSGVHPAGPGSGGPTGDEARANKKVLMDALGKYGITNERLDAVSNFYRYPPGRGEMWKHREATVNALIKNGAIVGYKIADGGAGYSSLPTVTVPGHPEATPQVQLSYGTSMESNGAISAIAVAPKKVK